MLSCVCACRRGNLPVLAAAATGVLLLLLLERYRSPQFDQVCTLPVDGRCWCSKQLHVVTHHLQRDTAYVDRVVVYLLLGIHLSITIQS